MMSNYRHIETQKIEICRFPGIAKNFSKMSNLPYFIGESDIVVYATISMHIVASTIVAYATICSARPMPRVGSSSRQAGRQKSVRLPKICPVWSCATGGGIPCPGLGVPPASSRSIQFNFAQKSAHSGNVCQICHILHHFGHARPGLSIPSHPIAKNLSDLARFSRFVPSVARLH